MNWAIDLNCDLGEGAALDAELMPLITSANICCGGHAGGPDETRIALELARAYKVQIGAHPGYPDRDGFGRVELGWSADQIELEVEEQLIIFEEVCEQVGVAVAYVKPHGALYNRTCRDEETAWAVVRSCERRRLAVMGLPNSALERIAGDTVGFIAEGFADRRYREDGTLVPRTDANPFVHSPEEAVAQVKRLLDAETVRTLCVHGDNPQALDFVRALRQALLDCGFSIQRFSRP